MSWKERLSSLRGNRWMVLVTSALGLFMVIIDSTVVNISIPAIISDLNTTLSVVEWVLNAYTLAFAALLITFGRLGDMFGRRLLFVIGLAIFGAGSAACGFAPSDLFLVGFRVVQALGAAFMMPATLSLISVTFPPHERGMAFGIWGAVSGFALGIGPTLGGFLTEYSWRYIFFINVPIVLLAIPLALLVIPESKDEGEHQIDWPGVALSMAALSAFNYGMIQGPSRSWDALIIGLLVASAVLLGVFLWWERRATEPLLDLSLFKSVAFSAGNGVGAMTLFAMMGTFFLVPLFLQTILGYSPLAAGLAIAPMSGALMLAGPLAGRYSDRFGARWFLFSGLLLVSGGILWMSFLSPSVTTLDLIPRFIVTGIGMGLTLSPLTSAVMSAAPRRNAGSASGVLSTIRRVGAVVGIAVLGAVLQSQVTANFAPRLAAATPLSTSVAQQVVSAERRSSQGLIGGRGPTKSDVEQVFRTQAGQSLADPAVRQAIAALPASASAGRQSELMRVGNQIAGDLVAGKSPPSPSALQTSLTPSQLQAFTAAIRKQLEQELGSLAQSASKAYENAFISGLATTFRVAAAMAFVAAFSALLVGDTRQRPGGRGEGDPGD